VECTSNSPSSLIVEELTLNLETTCNWLSRSFDSNEISVMQFFSPLTVIVGHNGSGKTVSSAVSSSLLQERKVGFSTRQGGDVRKSKR